MLATCILASSLAFVDGSVVNVALPAIGHSLHAPPGALPWVVNGYLLPLSALLLLGGAAGDRWGRRMLLMSGILVFALASLACALAPALQILVIGRLIQGCGAAMLMPTSLAVLGESFSGAARGRAIGIWASTGAIAGAVGPVLGGLLVDSVGWRAVFLINLPLAAAALLLAARAVPATETTPPDRPLDAFGAALATIGLGLLSWGLTGGTGPGGWSLHAGCVAAGGALLLLLFVFVEARLGEAAMMPLSLFGSKSLIGLTLLTLLVYAALGGLFVLLPYLLIEAGGYSATMAGASLLPLPALLALASPLAGSLAGRIGPRLPLTIGPAIVAAGFLMLRRVTPEAAYWSQILPALVVIAAGMAAAVAPLTTAVLSAVDPGHAGSASGLNSAVARTGGLFATAMVGSVLAAHGLALVGAFHVAATTAAGSCAAGALAAYTLLGREAPPTAAASS